MKIENQNALYSKKTNNNTMIASLILVFTLFFVLFVTYNVYSQYILSIQELSTSEQKSTSLQTELIELNKKKTQIDQDNDTKKSIGQFAGKYREDLILNQIYAKFDGVKVGNITMEKGQKLPIGLNMANISFSVDAKSIPDLNRYLDYLTGESSNIRFVIKNISLPLNSENTNSAIQANLSLGMYYFGNIN